MNLKTGDWLLCKNDFYEGDFIDNDGNLIGKKYMGVKKFFLIPYFKRGSKYQIKRILSNRVPAGGTGGLYNSNISPQYYTYISYDIERSDKRIEEFSEHEIKTLFYSHKEERKLKLKKLSEV